MMDLSSGTIVYGAKRKFAVIYVNTFMFPTRRLYLLHRLGNNSNRLKVLIGLTNKFHSSNTRM